MKTITLTLTIILASLSSIFAQENSSTEEMPHLFKFDIGYNYATPLNQWSLVTNAEDMHGGSFNMSYNPEKWPQNFRVGFGMSFMSNYLVKEDVDGFPFAQYLQVRNSSTSSNFYPTFGYQANNKGIIAPFIYFSPGLSLTSMRSRLSSKNNYNNDNSNSDGNDNFSLLLNKRNYASFSVGIKVGTDIYLDDEFGINIFGNYVMGTPLGYIQKEDSYLDDNYDVNYKSVKENLNYFQIGIGFVFK